MPVKDDSDESDDDTGFMLPKSFQKKQETNTKLSNRQKKKLGVSSLAELYDEKTLK